MLTTEELEPFQPSKVGLCSWNTPSRKGVELLIELLSGRMSVSVSPAHTYKGITNRTALRSSWPYRFHRVPFPPFWEPVDHASLHATLCALCVLHRFHKEEPPKAIEFARHLSNAIRRIDEEQWTLGYTIDPLETITFTRRYP